MSGSDLLLTCSDCNQEFIFTAGEQQFFQERGYSSPRRCKPCRQAKQGAGGGAPHAQSGGGGGNTYSGGGGGGYGGGAFGGGGFGGGAGAGMSTGTTVVCASCGQTTTVPFEPRGDRPVYCKACYKPKQGGGGGGSRDSRGGGGGGGRDSRSGGGGGGNRDRKRY